MNKNDEIVASNEEHIHPPRKRIKFRKISQSDSESEYIDLVFQYVDTYFITFKIITS